MRRILFFVTEDWFFCSHFLDRAVAAKSAGYDVVVLTRVTDHGGQIRSSGLALRPIIFDRHGMNPFRELRTISAAWFAYRELQPDLVHHFGLKPVLYGTIAAWFAGIARIVNAPVGMGFVFASERLFARILRPALRFAMHGLLNPKGSRVVFENRDDLHAFVNSGIVRAGDVVLVRGAGVDLEAFRPAPESAGTPKVVLVARMLWDKGVGEFVDAARLLKGRGVAARMLLVGAPDAGNPSAVPAMQLEAWRREGVVEPLGQRSDIAEILADAHIACLPSYREGLPKALLEALAAGRPIVTTDVPGCREVVIDGENGFLVPPRDPVALADALEKLIVDAGLRRRFGERSRALAEAEFGTERVNAATLALYREMLAG